MKHGLSKRRSPPAHLEFNQALAAFEKIAPAIVGLTPTGVIIYGNHSVGELFGYPREELERLQIRAIARRMTAADWSSFWLELDQEDSKPRRTTLHLSGKKELSVVFRALFNLPSGVKYCLATMPGKKPAAGVKRGAVSWPLDLVLNSMDNPIFVINEQHEITFLNQAGCRAIGSTLAEAAGMTVNDFLPKRYAEFAWKQDQRAFDSGRPASYVGDPFIKAKYGESVTMLPFLDPGTSQKRLLIIVKGVPQTAYPVPTVIQGSTELVPRRPISGYVSEMQEILEGGAPFGIFLKNTDNRYLFVNQVFARIAGSEPKYFIGKRVEDMISDPEALAKSIREDDCVYSTGKPLFNLTTPRFNGKSGYFRLDKFPFIDKDGGLAGIIGLVVEIDEPAPPIEPLKEELASTSKKLAETETALRVLIERREQDAALGRETLNAKVTDLLKLYLEDLKQTRLTPEQAEFVELIETSLKNLYDPAYARLSSPAYKLSPTELKVAQLIRDGKTNKEIAQLLHLSKSTILTHRHHVRVKLGIKNKKINLRSLLNS